MPLWGKNKITEKTLVIVRNMISPTIMLPKSLVKMKTEVLREALIRLYAFISSDASSDVYFISQTHSRLFHK